VFETDGQQPIARALLVIEGQKDRREQAVFGAGPTSRSTASAPRDSRGWATQRVLALISAGIGVLGVGLGAGFAAAANAQRNDAHSACPGSTCSTQDGVNKWRSAAFSGDIATVGFVVGGAALAGAGVLWLTAPGTRGPGATRVGIGPVGFEVRGTW
jgi:hypothetical protein